jgi:hypothetical protein
MTALIGASNAGTALGRVLLHAGQHLVQQLGVAPRQRDHQRRASRQPTLERAGLAARRAERAKPQAIERRIGREREHEVAVGTGVELERGPRRLAEDRRDLAPQALR